RAGAAARRVVGARARQQQQQPRRRRRSVRRRRPPHRRTRAPVLPLAQRRALPRPRARLGGAGVAGAGARATHRRGDRPAGDALRADARHPQLGPPNEPRLPATPPRPQLPVDAARPLPEVRRGAAGPPGRRLDGRGRRRADEHLAARLAALLAPPQSVFAPVFPARPQPHLACGQRRRGGAAAEGASPHALRLAQARLAAARPATAAPRAQAARRRRPPLDPVLPLAALRGGGRRRAGRRRAGAEPCPLVCVA
ncbi:hypothetical protein EMIHUDRAFT_465935, partial [Emiliania huxleyi CCMP1516]